MTGNIKLYNLKLSIYANSAVTQSWKTSVSVTKIKSASVRAANFVHQEPHIANTVPRPIMRLRVRATVTGPGPATKTGIKQIIIL